MRRLKTKLGWLLIVTAAVALTACGSEPADEEVLEEVDPPQINYIDEDVDVQAGVDDGEIGEPMTDMDGDGEADGEELEEKGGTVSETVMTELYLLDKNGLVAPQSINIPRGENQVEKAVEYLIQGGPITELLPNGFQAVLPSGTELLDVQVDGNGVATLNFSDQFSQYHPNLEMQVLQALTWTVTQMENVDRIKLQVNGDDLEMMPQNGTPISSGYTRAHGINLEMTDEVDIVNTKPVVVYFLSQIDNHTYYVPVTRRVPQQMDNYEAVITELAKGPDIMSPLLSSMRSGLELIEAPMLSADGTLTLNFNEVLLSTMEGQAISHEVLNMLVLSLTEQKDVQSVALQVESEGTIMVSTGETLTEPVSRPNMVNTGEY